MMATFSLSVRQVEADASDDFMANAEGARQGASRQWTGVDDADLFGGQLAWIAAMATASHLVARVVGVRSGSQMSGINATRMVTGMENAQPGWDGSNKVFIGKAVSRLRPIVEAELPVTLVGRGGPMPATSGLSNLGHESAQSGFIHVRRV